MDLHEHLIFRPQILYLLHCPLLRSTVWRTFCCNVWLVNYLLIYKRNNLKLTHAFNPIMPLQVFWMKVKLKIASGMSIYLICWGQSVLFLWLSFEKSRKEISSRVNLQNLQYTMGIPFCGWWQRSASACI